MSDRQIMRAEGDIDFELGAGVHGTHKDGVLETEVVQRKKTAEISMSPSTPLCCWVVRTVS